MVLRILVIALAALAAAPAWSVTPATPYKSQRVSTPEDISAIRKVADDFMAAVRNKSGKQLAVLVLHSRIMFTSPGDQARIDTVRGYDPNFDGIGEGGFPAFAKFVSTTPDKIEEKFYNTQITQDGPVALVTFDYEFYENDKVSNYGIEHWQMRKTDGKWKIFSVIWTQYETAVK